MRSAASLLVAAALAAGGCAPAPPRAAVPPPALKPSLLPRAELRDAGRPPGHLAVMEPPTRVPAAEAEKIRLGRGRFLVPSDRVIGVASGGEAAAYPLSLLRWHELVRDRVGGREVVVTYNPLAGSAAVWEPVVSGRSVRLTTSGTVYASSLLLEDLETRSLWSQVTGAAVTGPAAAAGLALSPLAAAVTTWSRWRARHPHTTVMAPLPSCAELYRRDPYHSYRGSDLLRFPVPVLPPPGSGRLKDPLAVVGVPPAEAVVDIVRHVSRAGGAALVEVRLGGGEGTLRVTLAPATAEVVRWDGPPPPVRLVHRFARVAWEAALAGTTSASVSE